MSIGLPAPPLITPSEVATWVLFGAVHRAPAKWLSFHIGNKQYERISEQMMHESLKLMDRKKKEYTDELYLRSLQGIMFLRRGLAVLKSVMVCLFSTILVRNLVSMLLLLVLFPTLPMKIKILTLKFELSKREEMPAWRSKQCERNALILESKLNAWIQEEDTPPAPQG